MPAQCRRGLTSHGATRFAIVIPIPPPPPPPSPYPPPPLLLPSSPPPDDDPHRKLAQRLGLGIAHTIFDAARGSFRVERKPEGMNVEIRLPQAGM